MTSTAGSPPHPPLVTLEALWRRKTYILICLGVSLVLGAVYLVAARPLYQVRARLLVEERSKPLEQGRGDEPGKDFLPTQAEIIRSPAVIQRAVETLALPPGPAGESPVVEMLEQLEVDPLLGTNVLSIQFQDADSTLAIKKARTIIDSYVSYLKSSEQDAYRETIGFLTEREKELRDELAALHERYAELRKESPVMGTDQASAELQRSMLAGLGQKLTLVKSRRVQLQNHLQQMIALRDGNLATEVGDQLVPTALSESGVPFENDVPFDAPGVGVGWHSAVDVLSRMAREGLVSIEDPAPTQLALLTARTREAELSQQFGPKHPELRGVRNMIDSLESRLRRAVDQAPAMLERELVALRSEEESLAILYDREFEKAKLVDLHSLEDQKTLDEMQRVRSTHDSIVARLNDSKLADQALAGGRASVSVRILDGPQLVNDLVWPQPVPLLALCGLIGLAAGFAWITAAEQLARLPAWPSRTQVAGP